MHSYLKGVGVLLHALPLTHSLLLSQPIRLNFRLQIQAVVPSPWTAALSLFIIKESQQSEFTVTPETNI